MSTDEQAVSQDETTEEHDQQEQEGRLTEERDDSPPAPPEADGDEGEDDEDDEDDEGDTFPRSYVKRLRERSAGYRTRAKESEERAATLERALFTERVRALDLLADPEDLPFNADALEDPDALRAAAEALVQKRPHLRRRGTTGPEVGAREHDDGTEPVSLLGIMRGGA